MNPIPDGSPASDSRFVPAHGEARLRAMLDHLTEAVFETDARGNCTFVNAAWQRLTGLDAAATLGHALEEFVHEEDREVHRARFRDVLEGRRATLHHEARLLAPDGAHRWVELHAHAASDAAGRVTHVVGTLDDTTLRREMEHELRQLAHAEQEARADAESAVLLLRVEAGQLERERDQAVATARSNAEFIVSMAHDLRTPLNGVLFMTDSLAKAGLDDDLREQAATARAGAECLNTLVSDLVTFSQADLAGEASSSREFDPRGVVSDVARLLGQKAVAKGITFSASVAPTVPERLRGNEPQFRQVITNLASNALRFTSEGGVTVAVSRAPSTREDGRVPIRIEIHDSDRHLTAEALAARLEARDTGPVRPGLPASAGLGLAMTRRLVERDGGKLTVGCEPGRGCFVLVEIPHERATASGPDAAARAKAGDAGQSSFSVTETPLDLHVLVADDHPINQKVASRTLERWGIRADVVGDGQAAVEAVAADRYDVVLMDVTMPVLNGLDATREIRRMEAASGRRTPIVAMTAHAAQGDRELCLESGMDGYVAKPIDAAELYAELRRWTSRPGERAAA